MLWPFLLWPGRGAEGAHLFQGINMILGIPLDDLFLWLLYVVGAMGSVLLVAGLLAVMGGLNDE